MKANRHLSQPGVSTSESGSCRSFLDSADMGFQHGVANMLAHALLNSDLEQKWVTLKMFQMILSKQVSGSSINLTFVLHSKNDVASKSNVQPVPEPNN